MKMNNKFLTLAVGFAFLCAGTLATSAQKYVDYTKHAQDLAVGDTVVMIDGNPSHYLTGEKIPKWVYTKRHSIMQIGTKRFPDGVLLREIYSWVDLHYMHKPQDVKVEETKPVVEATTTTVPSDDTDKFSQIVEPQPQQEEPKQEVQPEVIEQQEPQTNDEQKAKEEEPAKPGFQRFSIGVRGGAASLMQNAPDFGKWKVGYNVMLDLQYAYYFARKSHPERAPRHGILVDLSAGYTNSALQANNHVDEFTNSTLGGDFNYVVSANNVKEKDGQVQLELALMYSFLCKGFFFNVGPKAILPVYSPTKLNYDNVHIVATTPEGVDVRDEWVTGKAAAIGQPLKKWNNSKINLALAADLGYEFQLRNGDALGLGLYADYNLKDFGYKQNEGDAANSFINVEPVAGSAAGVSLQALTNTYADKLNGFDCGVKVIYHFNFPKQY